MGQAMTISEFKRNCFKFNSNFYKFSLQGGEIRVRIDDEWTTVGENNKIVYDDKFKITGIL